MEHDIKAIVIDIDGTLLNSEHKMSDRAVTTIKAVIEKGVQVILATGKTRTSAEWIIEKLGLTTPGIYMQGLIVYNPDGTIRHEQTLDADVARQVITYADDRGYVVIAYSGTHILMKSVNETGTKFSKAYHEPEPEGIGPLQNILGEMSVHKLMAIKPGDSKAIKALRWQLGMQLDEKAKLVQAAIPDMLEVVPRGSSKGAALRTLLREMDLKPDNVMAIGDGENDIEMVQLAKVGVAMENAAAQLKEVAGEVTASNDEDGVAKVIEKYFPDVAATPEPEAAETSESSASGESTKEGTDGTASSASEDVGA